jgi:hypothetical protein
MQIAYHLGVHSTDENQLLKCLLKNRDRLAAEGIALPGPSRFREPIRDTLIELKGGSAPPEMEARLLDSLIDGQDVRRLVISADWMLCSAERAIADNALYPVAGSRANRLRALFPSHQVTFYLGIRNPATFIPALFSRVKGNDFAGFMQGIDPMALRWSVMVENIRRNNPDCPLVVWSNEDTPLIWHELLRQISDHAPGADLDGSNDFLASIMTAEGSKRMTAYLKSHPPQNEVQRRRIVAAFLDKFGRADQIDMELDIPGWTSAYVEEMTERYEDDLLTIEGLPGVTFLTP